MNRRSPRRRTPWGLIGLFLGLVLAAAIPLALLAWQAWQQAQQVLALEAQVEALLDEQKGMDAQLASVQSTATALERRLKTLEASDPAQELAALQSQVKTADDSRELATLQAAVEELRGEVEAFQATLDGQAMEGGSFEPAGGSIEGERVPLEARLTIAHQRQSHNLSCEASAMSMVAHYYGLPLTEVDFLNALPLHDNPHLGFRGNVDGPTGGIEDYGVYAGPVMTILNDQGLRASPVEGGLDGIRAAIARRNPVIAWVTYNCIPQSPVETTIDGQAVTLVPNQHVVVVTGYNADGVWANDPLDGEEDFYPTADFVQAMGYFGNMAIEVAAP